MSEKELVRCYACKFYRGGKYKGRCTDTREGRKPIKVNAVDFCKDGVKLKEEEGEEKR